MAPETTLRLAPPDGATALVIVFSVPNYAPFRAHPETLTLRVDRGATQRRCCFTIGQHALLLALPPNQGSVLLHVTAARTFVPRELGLNQDTRRLSILIHGFQYQGGSGALLLSRGATVAQLTPLTTGLLLGLALTFVLALVLAWLRPFYAIVLLIVLEPFGSNIAFGLTTITFFKAALAGSLIGFAPRVRWSELWQRREALVPIACIGGLVAAALLSTVHAQYRDLAIREVLKYVEYALIFSVSFLAYRITRDRGIAGAAFILVAIAVCVAALAQEVMGAPETAFVFGHVVPRISGPLEGPNQLAGWLELLVPVLLCVRLQKELRGWATIAALLAIATSALTLSRAGMLGLAVGIAVFAFASQRAEGRRVAPVAIAVALAALATIAYRALPQGPDTPNDLFNNGLGTRSQLWHAAVMLWRSHPWFGIGAGNYETQLGRVGLVGVRTHANSWYLQSLAEGGIVMFAAVLATIYGLVVTFLNSRAAFATAALAATAAICAHQIFDDLIFFPKVGAMWWIIVGVGAAAASTMRLDSAVRRPEALA
jgi:O-antigen ligase